MLAVMVALSVQMTERSQIAFKRTTILIDQQQLVSSILGVQNFLEWYVNMELKQVKTIHLGQQWATSHSYPLDGGTISGNIRDMHSLFNLNALADRNPTLQKKNKERFITLLNKLGIDFTESQDIATRTQQWILATNLGVQQINDDPIYESKLPPYRPSYRLMYDLSEWRAVDGVTRGIYQQVAPYLCVLPQETKLILNVNTISQEQPEILVAMVTDEGLATSQAKEILKQRPTTGWVKIEDFFDLLNKSMINPLKPDSKNNFQVTSDLFEANMIMTINDSHQRVRLLLEKKANSLQTKRRIFGGDA